MDNQYKFVKACVNGHLSMVRVLLAVTGDRAVGVHADGEAAFRLACARGHLDVAQTLLALEGDRRIHVHAENELALRWACEYDHLPVVRELLALEGAQAPDPAVVKELGLEARYHAVRWDRRRAMLARRTAGQREARAVRAAAKACRGYRTVW